MAEIATGVARTPQERLIALLDYIHQVEKARRKPVFELPDAYFLAHEADIRALPGIECNPPVENDQIWLRVARQKETEPPELIEHLQTWVIPSRQPDQLPKLREEIEVPGPEGAEPQLVKLTDEPEIEALWRSYLDTQWKPWADRERPLRRAISVYNALFTLQQTIEIAGTATPLELVCGAGIALWRLSDGSRLLYPLITQVVELSLNPENFSLEVRPRDIDPVIEMDAFAALDLPGVHQVELLWKNTLKNAEYTFSPFDTGSFVPTLKAAVGYLDETGQFWPAHNPNPEDRSLPRATEKLIVTDTWVFFARRRSQQIFIADLERLKDDLERKKNVPGGPRSLVVKGSDEVTAPKLVFYRGVSHGGGGEMESAGKGISIRELYFPMPYNEEQVSIVRKLDTTDGVVVQGPPGTGKTHTIANIICHYLAHGQTVLVISEGEPALAVLRDQIPEEVRVLTVALLTNERDGMRQFEHAIETIASKVSEIHDPEVLKRDIRNLEGELDRLHQRIAITNRDIAKWATGHLTRVPFGGREMQPDELAEYVVKNENACAWFVDPVTLRPEHAPTVSDEEIGALRRARIALQADLAYLGCLLPTANDFPDGVKILELHRNLVRANETERLIQDGKLPALVTAGPEAVVRAQKLHAFVSQALALFDDVMAPGHEWTEELRSTYRQHATRTPKPTLDALDEILAAISALAGRRQSFIQTPVAIPENADLDDEFLEAVERRSNGKRAYLIPIGKGMLKQKLSATTMSGLAVTESQEDWQIVHRYCRLLREVRTVAVRWNACAAETVLPQASTTEPSVLLELTALASHIEQVKRLAREVDAALPAMVREVFGERYPRKSFVPEREPLEELRASLSTHLDATRLIHARRDAQALGTRLEGKSGAVADAMREFLARELGNPDINEKQVMDTWSAQLAELRRTAALEGPLAAVTVTTRKLENCGAVKWAKALRTQAVTGDGDSLTHANWFDAWQWRRARTHLDGIDGRKELRELYQRRRDFELSLITAYRNLIANKTWLMVYEKSPPSVRQALQLYLNAIKHIGKGKGRRAIRYREDARRAMDRAYQAVPCWIMPRWRVSESLPPEVGKFDVVIMDEASQSDIWALPALLRGKKLLIVGDDKQVSPSAIGFEERKIVELKNRYLGEQAFGTEMTPEKSIYDLALAAFAGTHVMLKEHFRCVAPIIEFSRREFYSNLLRPLRIPTPAERLDPPLVDVFVKGGYRAGNTNPPEVAAIVNEVKNVVSDPRFTGRTIGIVSLLAIDQAKAIYDRLREALQAEEFVERKITVGDARAFQGKERDIMFLSMVASPEAKATTVGATYEQRFNVAASRARDRMYLFRSVEYGELNKEDLKAKLIAHFRQPFTHDVKGAANLRARCKSPFEIEMFDILVDRGYRVTPQVAAGGYSIDLVVEGRERRRLAIECDGDRFHGPAQWAADMDRQRVLERAGWTFWRIFASTFVLNKPDVIAELQGVLQRMGIEPIGAEGVDQSLITEHRIIGLPEDEDDTVVINRGVDRHKTDQRTQTAVIHGEQPSMPTPIRNEIEADPEVAAYDVPAFSAHPPQQATITVPEIPVFTKISQHGELRVKIGDLVRYVDLDQPDQERSFCIVADGHNPAAGLINEGKPIAQALLGAAEGNVIEVPIENRRTKRLRLIKIERAAPSAPAGSELTGSGTATQRTEIDLVQFCQQHGLEMRDKRSQGGSLWVHHDSQRDDIAIQLKRMGFRWARINKAYWRK